MEPAGGQVTASSGAPLGRRWAQEAVERGAFYQGSSPGASLEFKKLGSTSLVLPKQ